MKERIRRWLRPEDLRPHGFMAGSSRLDKFWIWAAGFPSSDLAELRERIDVAQDGTWVVLPHPRLSRFKLWPELSLRIVRDALEPLMRDLPAPAVVVWALDCVETHGLDPAEAEAVFGPWLAIEHIYCTTRGDRDSKLSKLIVVGRFREEFVGLSFTIERVRGAAAAGVAASLELVGARQLPFVTPIAALFLGTPEAQALVDSPDRAIARLLRERIAEGACSLGLRIDRDAGEDLVLTLGERLRPLQQLSHPAPVRYVRIEGLTGLDVHPEVGDALSHAGLQFDTSFREPDSYLRAGAYWPQPFDRRTPAGARTGLMPVEVVAIPIGQRTVREAWRRRTEPETDRLIPLLTFERIERYHRDLEPRLEFAHVFHDYRVFNWPRPEPAARVTWLDGGTFANPIRVGRLMHECRALAGDNGERVRVVNSDGFAAAALREANSRLPASSRAALAGQKAAHAYLENEPREGPLRPDYAAFARFVPESLGDVLELGSGYGQLAHALQPRVSDYLCVELDAHALGAVRSAGLKGVAADVHKLPFAAGSFDAVVANNVLEHAYDPAMCLREIRRVLRTGGRLLALMPLDALNPRFDLRAHWWKADRPSIERALRMAGLVPARIEEINLYALGVRGAFPAQNGLACQFEATKN